MKHILFTVLIFGVLFSCKESSEMEFEKDGISFTSPASWKITDQETMSNNAGYFLSVERDGFSSSGLLTLTWVYDSLDLSYWLDLYKEGFMAQFVYKNSDLIFEAPVSDVFNNYNTIAVNYTVSILGVEHEGLIHVFHGYNKTIAIVKQEAIEDKDNNRVGFDIIEQSFSLDENLIE